MSDINLNQLRHTVNRLFRHVARLNMYVCTCDQPKPTMIEPEIHQLNEDFGEVSESFYIYQAARRNHAESSSNLPNGR